MSDSILLTEGVSVDVSAIAKRLSREQKEDILDSLIVTDDELMRACCRRLVERQNDSMWSSTDPEIQLEFLAMVEDRFAKGCKWSLLRNALETLRRDRNNLAIYWKMRHDPEHEEFFFRWLEKHGLKSEYEAKEEKVDKLEEWIKGEIEKMSRKPIDELVDKMLWVTPMEEKK